MTGEPSPITITNAIRNRYAVIITYDDTTKKAAKGARLFEPYVYGVLTSGNYAVRGFQYNGSTRRGVPKWKLFLTDRIMTWDTTGKTFNQPPKERGWSAPAYNLEGDKAFAIIFAKVSFTDDEMSTDTLSSTRNRAKASKESKPINISQMTNVKSREDRQREMIARNLEITRKEKEKRGLDMSGNKMEVKNKIQPSPDVEPDTGQPKNGPIEPMDSDDKRFQEMLKRNMEITAKEKDKRGFSLSKNNYGPQFKDDGKQEEEKKSEDEIIRDMIKRNLEITRKEKEKRGFKL